MSNPTPTGVDQAKLERRARGLAIFARFERKHTGTIAAVLVPSSTSFGKKYRVEVFEREGSPTSFSCSCRWSEFHPVGKDFATACAHVRAARISLALLEYPVSRRTMILASFGEDDELALVEALGDQAIIPDAALLEDEDLALLADAYEFGELEPADGERYTVARHVSSARERAKAREEEPETDPFAGIVEERASRPRQPYREEI